MSKAPEAKMAESLHPHASLFPHHTLLLSHTRRLSPKPPPLPTPSIAALSPALTVGHHDDLVRRLHRAEAVRDHEHRAARDEALDRLLHELLRHGVEPVRDVCVRVRVL